MGLPALRHEPQVARRPHLRVVKSNGREGSHPRARSKTSHAAAHQAFVFFAVLVGVVALLGLGRVWLSVEAAQASIDAGKLQTAIRAARYEGDVLEVQQSALATPSRIQALATGTMGMAPATSVSYLNLGSSLVTPVAEPAEQDKHPVAVELPGVLANVMSVAAGEAHVLLAGDVALASSK
jgi:cell division protein FtsL